VRHEFSVAESFGMIFEETLAEVPLDPDEEGELYSELLDWARRSTELFPDYSARLFTTGRR